MTSLYNLFPRVGWIVFFLIFFAGFTAYSQCLTIRKVTVSGCYSVTNVSKATVSVEVGWTNAPANSRIIVTTGTQSRTITPGAITVNYGNNGSATPSGSQTIVTPQVVAFEINATGPSTTTVSARFTGNANCTSTVTASYTVPASCNPTVCQTGGIGGKVFNDYDADGVMDAGETNGVGGITVKVITCNNTTVQTTSDADGQWSISSALAYPVRVEFSNIPTAYLETSTINGTGSRTTVQFINAASCNVNLGVNDPKDYCQSTPLLITPCYISGDPLITGGTSTTAAGKNPAIVGFPYENSGLTAPKTFSIAASAVGTTWAQTYSKYTKRLFSAATIKRHAGLGPGGLDAIYVTNLTTPSSPVVTGHLSLSSLGIDVGSLISNSARGLVSNMTQPSNDPQSFTAIGKIGIGGMSLSSDGETLYLMNIKDNSLYALDLSTFNSTLNINSITKKGGPYAVPGLGCTNGQQRSWAVKYYKGKVYVGTICDASSGTRSDLRAGVFAFDPTTNTFDTAPIFDFPLTYSKGFPDNGDTDVTGWYPWTDSFSNIFVTLTRTTGNNIARPTPILSDLEFDIDGSLVLAFNDRTGLQTGFLNWGTSGTSTYYSGHVGGDILRAFYKGGAFVLENAAKAGPASGYASFNNQGPGFGEFYNDDSGADLGEGLYHSENGLGALALRPGSGEVVSAVMDPTGVNTPYDFAPFSGGVRHMSNKSGLVNDAYLVYQTSDDVAGPRSGTFGKATGLGDLELTCDLIQYLQIGNRVWIDTDKDGVQDACEKGLHNVKVSLYRSGTLVATTTTDANGEYYFSYTAVQPNTAYQLVFGTSGQFSGSTLTVDNGKYQITVANSTSVTGNDLNDSDAQIATVAGITAPIISLTTGSFGEVNHTFDLGVVCLTTTVGSVSVTPATCVGVTPQNNARISLSGLVNAEKAAIYPASQTTPPAYTATASLSVVGGTVSFTGLSNPTAASGTAYRIILYNGPCCSTIISTTLPQTNCNCALSLSVTPGACDPVTNRYAVSGTVSFTHTPASSLTITDAQGGRSTTVSVAADASSVTFSLTGLSSGSGTHTISVISSATACASVSRTYAAPTSCTVPAVVNVNSKTVCAGQAASLTATGCTGTLLWSGPNGFTSTSSVITVSTASTMTSTTVFSYTARCTTVTNTTTAVGTITVVPIPTVSLTASPSLTVVQGSSITLTAIGCQGGTLTWNVAGMNGNNTRQVTVMNMTNTYSVTCTNQPNCSTTASLVITAIPATSLVVNSVSVCAGETATLMADGCNGGQLQWTGNGINSTSASINIPTSVTTTTLTVRSYTVTCTNAATVTSAVATVSIVPQPTVSLSVQGGAGSLTLVAVGCAGGELHWSTGQTTSSIVVTPTATTLYSVTCTVPPGCSQVARKRIGFVPSELDIVTSGAFICAGQSVTLTASNCIADVTWSTGTTGATLIVSPTVTTGYSVTCSDEVNTASASTTVVVSPTPTLTLTASTLTPVDGASVTLTASGCQSGTVVWSTGASTPAIVVSTTVNAVYSATCTTGPQCSKTTSISLTVSLQPQLSIEKFVSTQRAKLGEVISYTVILTNSGLGTASNVLVRDSISSGLAVVPGSASTSVGTYAPGDPIALWTIPTLPANASATLTFSASVLTEGVVYNTASIPGDTATVCTSVPIVVCKGSDYAILITAPVGHTRYQWYRRVGTAPAVVVADGTVSSFTATEPGEYRVVVDDEPGSCPDLSCCPLIIEEDSIPTFTVMAKSPSCIGNQPQPNGSLTLMGLGQNPSDYTYAISVGSSFTVANPVPVAVPSDGVILSALSETKTYTVRVYNQRGCYHDVTVTVDVNCTCPEEVCVPVLVKKVLRR